MLQNLSQPYIIFLEISFEVMHSVYNIMWWKHKVTRRRPPREVLMTSRQVYYIVKLALLKVCDQDGEAAVNQWDQTAVNMLRRK